MLSGCVAGRVGLGSGGGEIAVVVGCAVAVCLVVHIVYGLWTVWATSAPMRSFLGK